MLHYFMSVMSLVFGSCVGLSLAVAGEQMSTRYAHVIEQAKLATVGILQTGSMQTGEPGYEDRKSVV